MTCFTYNNFFKKLSLIIIFFSLNGCNTLLLDPHGLIAVEESSLILISFIMMLFIIIPVIFMSIYFPVKYCSKNKNQTYEPDWSDSKKIEIVIWSVPILIISFLAFLSWDYTHKLEPKKPIVSFYKPIKINVIALDWKWLFIYPDYHIATINEIMLPVDRPISFEITSNSVMNSFFIPSLGSQIYAMPGMVTKLNLISNSPGKYKGISSNYSGRGFSNMKFTVISALNDVIFKNWIKKIQKSPNKLNTSKMFNVISIPNENCSVEYFSYVKKDLFNQIVNQYSLKNLSILNKYTINKKY
ncbi:MAG: ubiquinol oxidase subunit II [Buchnera aphidicola (Brevicoryne brassicae)]|uniref:Ubiquinol oxidase subunit 2 n=1 Tax=Buchnera aphidicola (Brevicoryne brassicae) TaxID=911343 RepID=A0AAJ5TX73_9GAMM|nr:ubiquinol oxidase subunit II [Buchnera aphidicola]QCI20019.1 ubiquinol oxidase subunit II [Buchnera aphidicola (Brevicoryne brassicae)]WAI18843.1 MAG: ubiquinol oxidase subunit II [Buchnera aphidicola (Brevicoryne brassicae)]